MKKWLNVMKNKTESDFFEWFIISSIVYGTYFVIKPYIAGGVYDLNHKLICVFELASVLVFLCFARLKITNKILWVIILIIVSFFSVFLSGAWTFSYFTKWIIFVTSLFHYCIVISHLKCVTPRIMKLLFYTSAMQIITHTIAAFNMDYYVYFNSGRYLMLAFDNKNSAALQLLLLGSVFAMFSKYFQFRKQRVSFYVSLLMLSLCVILIFLTGSRSSMVAIVFILPFLFIKNPKKIVSKGFAFSVLIFPLVFALVYVFIYKLGFTELSLGGRKLFNGRESMWGGVVEGFPLKWIFGMFSEYTVGDGSQPFQLHNGWLDMLASYGAPTLLIFVVLTSQVLFKLLQRDNTINLLIAVCILGCVIQSTGEAALMMGSRAMYVSFLFLFWNIQGGSFYEFEKPSNHAIIHARGNH